MTFLQFAQQWTTTIFRIMSDLYAEIMSHQFTAFAFWAAIVCGGLYIVGGLIIDTQSLANDTKQADRNMTAANRGLSRVFQQHKKRLARQRDMRREKYAQFLMNTRDYSKSRYVTIEGKRYYRKGLVQRGEQMKSSDRDFLGDLEDIENS